MTLTVDDRELIDEAEKIVSEIFAAHGEERPPKLDTFDAVRIEELSDRLQSLLSLLERVWACRVDVQGRFVNLEKLWSVIDDIGVALSQREVP